jgi:UDP-N-acetyl-D-galactosamine dehydrogenase
MHFLPDKNCCTIAVIGLGYVGLPVAVEFAKQKISFVDNKEFNHKIIGFDINENRINELRKGFDKTGEVNVSGINKLENIIFTSDPSRLVEAEVFIVTVPTPIDKSKNPDLSLIKQACKTIGKAIKNNTKSSSPVIIFESTVYPGASEEEFMPIISSFSGLPIFDEKNMERSLAFGYSPERINPGDKDHRISSIVKVTSGNTENVSYWVDYLYASIIKAGTYNAKNIKVAEAAKVIENTQRDLNIALINELSIVFKKMNIDTLDVINAAKTKWNFLPFKPGLVGGHCIGVDPYYLTYKSEKVGYYPEVILAGRKINDGMAIWYVEELIKEMYIKDLKIDSVEALVLGFTFKENCPDTRNTKVFDLINALNKNKIKCDVVDPFANKDDTFAEYGIRIENDIPTNKRYSLVILAVSHENFCKFDYLKWKSLCEDKSIILDLKGIVPKELHPIRP